jgi:hypothetical protein
MQHDARAGLGKRQSHRRAKSARGTGHERGLAGEPELIEYRHRYFFS